MTNARSEIVDNEEVGIYHCVSRCVRRAYLCGHDSVSGRSFEHRRLWIRGRLSFLTEIFAIEVVAYAVMSNHLHSLIRIRPDVAGEWSAEEVARRWRLLFPLRRVKGAPAKPNEAEIEALVHQPKKIALYRERLSSVSWFNRCLNEKIARQANAEDECKGRFWEGRFKCQRVYDLAGVVACAVYIDLNPVRAGMAKTLEESDHTSVQERLGGVSKRVAKRCSAWPKVSLLSVAQMTERTMTLEEYLELVDETGRLIVEGKKSISEKVEPILRRLKVNPERWVENTKGFRERFKRVVGAESCLRAAAKRAKKRWFAGVRAARGVFLEGAALSKG